MPRRMFNPTERIGVNAVERIVTLGFGWFWREQCVADFGVDAARALAGTRRAALISVWTKSLPSRVRPVNCFSSFPISSQLTRVQKVLNNWYIM